MKRIILVFVFSFFGYLLSAQTDGISYQAVIIDNNPQEIPGVDIPSNNLPNVHLKVQFSIIDDTDSIEYQEDHDTTTDPYGMINLMVGHGNSIVGAFNEIYWNDDKFLKVEIDLLDGNGLIEFSYQELTYIPYVKHREIIATSTLDVDGATNLNNNFNVNNASPSYLTGDLTVDGETNLNSALTVNNQSPTLLTGDLTVEGLVSFDGGLEVGGDAQLYADLTVEGNTLLNGTLDVIGEANFGDSNFQNITVAQNSNLNVLDVSGVSTLENTLNVNANSNLSGQVTINAVGVTTAQANYSAYPLQVEGSQQGIAIKISPNNPNRNNNYLAFWDGDDTIRGRVEASNGLVTITTDLIWDLIGIPDFGDIIDADPGDNPPDVAANQYFNNDYAFGAYSLTVELVNAIIRFGINAFAASGLCLAGDCDDAVWSFVDIVVAGIQLGGYITYNEINMGVAFESGGADYAEWLKKANPNDVLNFGDVVGVKGGIISKSFNDAEKFMVVSQNPMVSGAMPDEKEVHKFEKIAFLGQVPVKVLGAATIGDYIIPSGNADGYAVAISPDNMKINDYKRIIGVAWSESKNEKLFSYIQTAIGINTNDMANQVEQMQAVMNVMQASLAKLDKEYKVTRFDVDEISTIKNKTKVSTLKERVADESEALDYNNLKEALQNVVKTVNNDPEFDVLKMPYIQDMIDNPTKETAEKMVKHYTKVLNKLEKMRPVKRE